jgi:hypothetical protein
MPAHRLSQSQKRASVLLSDVSQSLFAALSPLSPATDKGAWLPSPGGIARAPPLPVGLGIGRAPLSLLDDDDDVRGALSPALQPSPALKPSLARKPAPAPASALAPAADIDDDWNW